MMFILAGVLLLGVGMYYISTQEAPKPANADNPAPATKATEAEIMAARAKAIATSQAFGKELKGTLVAAIKEGGPMQGVEVCNSAAPAIAHKHSSDEMTISRTSMRTRNPGNAPDDWQQASMQEFTRELADGRPAAEISAERLTTLHGKPALQVMTPIVMGKPCLTCHGTEVKPDLLAKIRELYPDDQATGFHEGELRGAFNMVVALQTEPAQADGS